MSAKAPLAAYKRKYGVNKLDFKGCINVKYFTDSHDSTWQLFNNVIAKAIALRESVIWMYMYCVLLLTFPVHVLLQTHVYIQRAFLSVADGIWRWFLYG